MKGLFLSKVCVCARNQLFLFYNKARKACVCVAMGKRDREERLWGWLVPHNPLCGGPAPLRGRAVIIGREGDVRAPCNPHLSRRQIRLEREDDGKVYATHVSETNHTWLNCKKMERGQRTLVEPCEGNKPHQLRGEAPDAPLLFVSVVHACAARAMLEDKRLEGWCGWSLRLAPERDRSAAAAASVPLAVAPSPAAAAAVAPAPAPAAAAMVVHEEVRTPAAPPTAVLCPEEPVTKEAIFRGVRLLLAVRRQRRARLRMDSPQLPGIFS